MAVFKIHRTEGFTILSTHHLKNKEMSLKAKGLLSIMLSLPEDWDYSVNGLAALSKDGRDSIMGTLDELKKHGYLVMDSKRNDRGQYETIYDVYEEPNCESRVGKSDSVNPTQYIINNKEYNNSVRENNKDNNLILFQEVKEKEKEENNYLVIFDSFRRIYRGTKRGNEVEFKNFVKKHADWKEILPKLLDMYKSQCALLDERARRNLFVPQPKNLQTYINQRCWEEEITLEDYGNDTRKNQSRIQYGNAWCELDQRLRAAANGQQDASLDAIASIL